MPALSSSLIGPALEQFSDLPASDRAVLAGQCPGLLEYLAGVPDPRDRRGVRHSLASLLMTAVAAVLAGNAHYILVVKKNQPTLHAQLKNLPWRQIPAAARQHDRGHGREEHRTLQAAAVAAGLAFPHAAQAIRLTRRIRPLAGQKKWRTVTVYAITSLTAAQATPGQLAAWIRGHWQIEVRHEVALSLFRAPSRAGGDTVT